MTDPLGSYSVPAWTDLSNVNRFCYRCLSIPWHTLINRKEQRTTLYEPLLRLVDMRNSAHAGCHICTLNLSSLLATRFRRERDGNKFLDEAMSDIADDSEVRIDVDWDKLDDGRVRRYLKLEIADSAFGWGGEHLPIFIGIPYPFPR